MKDVCADEKAGVKQRIGAALRGSQVSSQMGNCRRVSFWTVEEVRTWVKEQYPLRQIAFLSAVGSHSISGRSLLRINESHLEKMGIQTLQGQEILLDILLLRVQEELENLNDIVSLC